MGVSYGLTYTTQAPCTIAVVCIGYADGLSRSLSGRIRFQLHGQRVPVVGRICMDMCMIDVTNVPEAKVGDVVKIFGGDISVTELSDPIGSIPYETICGLNKRIPRLYLDGRKRTDILQYIV